MMRININADFLAQADVSTPASTTGLWGPATGVADFVLRIAATKTGTALGTLTATATARSADTDRYYTTFDKAALTTALATYVGRTVYVILSRSGDLDGLWWPALVTDEQAGT